MTRATNGKPTEPAVYHDFFERGIDPDIDDPTKCHSHSELPEVWPSLEEILDYRESVKDRISMLYCNTEALIDRTIGRALWIGFEHEGKQDSVDFPTFILQSVSPASGDILVHDFAEPQCLSAARAKTGFSCNSQAINPRASGKSMVQYSGSNI